MNEEKRGEVLNSDVETANPETVDAGEPIVSDLEIKPTEVAPVEHTEPLPLEEALGQETKPEAPIQSFTRVENATQDFPTSSAREKGTPDMVMIPPAGMEEIEARLNNQPNVDNVVSKNQRKWLYVMHESLRFLPEGNFYNSRLTQQDATFKQQVTHNGVKLRGVAPSFKKEAGTREIEGEAALLQIVSHLGVGGLFRTPLWNSGFWVTFKPATEVELLELNRAIASDKIKMGRYSYGLALSNNIVYTLDRVFEFALRHVYNTSVRSEELPLSELKNWVAPQDIYSFIWGFLSANYPSGFHYSTGCVVDPTKCTHVVEETLNVTKLQWVDEAALTDWQKTHMTGMSANSKSLDSIKRYKDELKLSQKRRIVVNKDTKHEMAFTLKTPTITEYIEQGHRWIGGIVESINGALEMNASAEERNTEINRVSKATSLRQYIHWIDSIEYGQFHEEGADEASVKLITDRETIENVLSVLSATDSIREAITDETIKYINESTLAVIGVPSFNCPACGKPQLPSEEYPRHASIIPIDILQVFFALVAQRLGRADNR
jgi:hypothetical protein